MNPTPSTPAGADREIIADLTRVKALFQLRAITAVMGVPVAVHGFPYADHRTVADLDAASSDAVGGDHGVGTRS
ncbi:MAG TPA: hypothetical protein VF695_17190 [Sphingomonas sp.]|jgi:hypothetical protein